ncbi:Nn.00g059210.m01.CDS01 [Neocucurbitaria sp. VM-36]
MFPSPHQIEKDCDELALFFLIQNRPEEAYQAWHQAHLARLRQAPTTSSSSVEQFDPSWADSLDLIGVKLHLQGNDVDAERYLREALTEKEKGIPFGRAEYMRIVKSWCHLARCMEGQGKLEESEVWWRRVVAWCKDQNKSEGWWRRVIGWYKEEDIGKKAGEKDILQCMSEFARVLSQVGKVDEALEMAKSVLWGRERISGPMHQETLESVWMLASVLEKKGREMDALSLYERAYKGAEEVLGAQHVDTKDYLSDYDRLRQKLGPASHLQDL